MKIFIGFYMLAGGEEFDQEPFAVLLETTNAVQISQGICAKMAKTIGRGNRITKLRFSVRRNHLSILHATDFLLIHASDLADAMGNVVLVSEGPSPKSYQLDGAVIRHIQGNQQGCATTHDYEIVGGLFSIVETKKE
ncbi:MAG: hypothetical protein LBG86_00890 [Puniceicoccales bacterium]|jgi:hypothetical protein|nr:hypothetical protein [Puniceicoccales bacterium]